MMPETWLALAAGGLLAAAALARTLALLGIGLRPRRGNQFLLGLRAAAAVALAVALGMGLVAHPAWLPLATWQVALALALAALGFTLALWGRYGFDGAGPAVDLIAVGLVALAMAPNWPGVGTLTCAQRDLPYQAAGVLFLVGAGGTTVAGSIGLTLAFRSLLARRGGDRFPGRADLFDLMKGATVLTLVVLGGGLLAGTWWAWRTLGRWVAGDPRSGWMAVAWLLALISWLAWRLAGRGSRWVAAFALFAALAANVGLLVAAQLQNWLRF
jgi:hypothetical protein